MFQPDALLPTQYLATFHSKTLGPEKKLMLAVLEDGISCFQKHLTAKNRGGKTMLREVEEWMGNGDSEWPFSFKNICDALGIDAGYLRRGLHSWKGKKLSAPGGAKTSRGLKQYNLPLYH